MNRDNDTNVRFPVIKPSKPLKSISNFPRADKEPFSGCERELRTLLEFRTDKKDFRVMVGESESDHYCAHVSIQALKGGDHFTQAEHCIEILLMEGYKIIRWPQKLSENETVFSVCK